MLRTVDLHRDDSDLRGGWKGASQPGGTPARHETEVQKSTSGEETGEREAKHLLPDGKRESCRSKLAPQVSNGWSQEVVTGHHHFRPAQLRHMRRLDGENHGRLVKEVKAAGGEVLQIGSDLEGSIPHDASIGRDALDLSA